MEDSRNSRINNPHKSSRRLENTPADLVDNISVLPDSILGFILSYLPTKDVVATTILSKRWKSVWINVHNLDFNYVNWMDDNSSNDEDQHVNFVRFVNRVLLLNGGGLLNKFRLVWEPESIPSQVSLWVSSAVTRNVRQLFLISRARIGLYPSDIFEMPISVFSCVSLQCLELDSNIYVSAAVVVSLPRLESLKLDSVRYESGETFQKLLSGCPKLKILHVILINEEFYFFRGIKQGFKTGHFKISLPSLRRLHLCVGCLQLRLELEAFSLEYLKLEGCIPQVFVKGSLCSLVEADLGIQLHKDEYHEDIYYSFAKRLHSFDSAKALTLSPDVMWVLRHTTISLSTKFTRLTKLKARFYCCYFSSLQDVMQCSDSLEVLTVDKVAFVEYNHDHSKWTAPVEVPRCLSNNLKEVSFKGYIGCDDGREMIGYLLKHGSALQVMKVTCDEYNMECNEIELVKEICRFPRKSPACIVEFIK